jgi:hypothetical protein
MPQTEPSVETYAYENIHRALDHGHCPIAGRVLHNAQNRQVGIQDG